MRYSGTRTRSSLSFTESLMTYALGRRVEAADMPTVRRIIRDAAASGLSRCRAFINGVIDSPAFQMARLPRRAGDDHGWRGA